MLQVISYTSDFETQWKRSIYSTEIHSKEQAPLSDLQNITLVNLLLCFPPQTALGSAAYLTDDRRHKAAD